jgi:hypothetical protein
MFMLIRNEEQQKSQRAKYSTLMWQKCVIQIYNPLRGTLVLTKEGYKTMHRLPFNGP